MTFDNESGYKVFSKHKILGVGCDLVEGVLLREDVGEEVRFCMCRKGLPDSHVASF